MRINLIIPSFYPAVIYGGPIFSSLHTCQELVKLEDTEVFVSTTNANMTACLDVQKNQWLQLEENFFVKYYNDTIINTLSLPLLLSAWKDIKMSDVVHVQYIFSTPTPIALLYAKIFNKPIILSPRGALCSWCLAQGCRFKKLWLQWLLKPLVKNILWHATAEQESNDIKIQFPNASVVVIPNGIDYEVFQTPNHYISGIFYKKYGDTSAPIGKIIVSMGRLQKKKGFDILIDAFAKAIEHYPNAKLFIAGGDEGEEVNLRDQIQCLGLENSTFLVGAISGQDKIDFLANADLFALSSYDENFGNVYAEALAAGTPIVASLNTPWSEVESGDCGKWVNNSVSDTAQAMIEMLGRDREQMRVNAKKLAKKYDRKNIALQFKELFTTMIEQQ